MGLEQLGLLLFTISVGTTAYSIDQQRTAQQAQERGRQAQINQAKTETRRKQMEQLARMRAYRANTINIAEQTGVGTASTTAGAVGAITSSAAENIGYLSGALKTSEFVAAQSQAAADATGKASLAEAVGSVASSVAGATGAYDAIFKTPTAEPEVPDVFSASSVSDVPDYFGANKRVS